MKTQQNILVIILSFLLVFSSYVFYYNNINVGKDKNPYLNLDELNPHALVIKPDLSTSNVVTLMNRQDFYTVNRGVCAASKVKTYMSYKAITNKRSKQYSIISNQLTIDPNTGLLYDDYGYFAVALGSYYGELGDRFIFELSNGNELPVIKTDEKSDNDTVNGCYHSSDSSVIEFVIDPSIAKGYFGSTNGLVSNGNFNNYSIFRGTIIGVKQVYFN